MSGKKEEPEIPFNDVKQAFMTFMLSEDKAEVVEAKRKLKQAGEYFKKNALGFFTPYRSGLEFGWTLVSPVIAPAIGGIFTGLVAITAAAAAVTALGSLVFAGGAVLFNKTHAASDALSLAAIAGVITGIAAALTLVSTIMVAVSIPIAVAALVTRSGATVISALSEGASKLASCCCPPTDAEDVGMQNLSSLAPR